MARIGDVIYTDSHDGQVIAATDLDSREVTQVAPVTSSPVLFGLTSLGPLIYVSTGDSILSLDSRGAARSPSSYPSRCPTRMACARMGPRFTSASATRVFGRSIR